MGMDVCRAVLIAAPASGQGKTTVTDLLQPGPAALTDGLRQIADIIRTWSERRFRVNLEKDE